MSEVDRILRLQSGVVARRQALASGLTVTEVNRLVRRREWVAVHPGVYVDHTGSLSWLQRAWAAVQFSWPAALSHDSALRAGDGPGRRSRDDSTIHVAVGQARNLVEPSGVRVHRMTGFGPRVRWNLSPPRVRYEDAVLDCAAEAATDLDAVARLADACGTRRTTAERLLLALDERSRIARRGWLRDVLADVASGTCSVLEHGYLTLVERPHGLPRGERQVAVAGERGSMFRDVEHATLRLVVELDGRLFHESVPARDRDLDRDLEAAASTGERETVRLGYGQVFSRPCLTASRIARVMQRRGWTGAPVHCPSCAGPVRAA